MSTLDEITKEKQRVSEALARVDAQREKLTGQLGELEATERVLARYSTGTRGNKDGFSQDADHRSEGGRSSAITWAPADYDRNTSWRQAHLAPTLGDQVLALATGKTQQEITAACKGARPNHVGVVIARHKRAGRIELRDGKLYATQSDPGSLG
jgi:hypothetical protein